MSRLYSSIEKHTVASISGLLPRLTRAEHGTDTDRQKLSERLIPGLWCAVLLGQELTESRSRPQPRFYQQQSISGSPGVVRRVDYPPSVASGSSSRSGDDRKMWDDKE